MSTNQGNFSPEQKERVRAALYRLGINHPDELPEIPKLEEDPVLRPLFDAAIREDPQATIEETRKTFFERNPTTCERYKDLFELAGFLECAWEILRKGSRRETAVVMSSNDKPIWLAKAVTNSGWDQMELTQ